MATKAEILDFIKIFGDKMAEHRQELTDLDQVIGDGDHGINMNRGFNAVGEKLPTLADKSITEILKTVGMTLVSTVGGAAGPLYGTAFMRAGESAKSKEALSDQDVILAFDEGVGGIKFRGKAVQGEKTILDSMIPAIDAIKKSIREGKPMTVALDEAEKAAWEGVAYTKTIIATKGRASYLGERSIGHQDPGATSMAYLFQAAKEAAQKSGK
ncbi:dihydroxyacetone kinase subunit DhaL [Acetobacterium sp.]|uniref:dihydroxyacetone kinase subunit DhaL n=1 Tax=Acetobacterium sp. TaxID=1872094 RepID=UPI002F422B96